MQESTVATYGDDHVDFKVIVVEHALYGHVDSEYRGKVLEERSLYIDLGPMSGQAVQHGVDRRLTLGLELLAEDSYSQYISSHIFIFFSIFLRPRCP